MELKPYFDGRVDLRIGPTTNKYPMNLISNGKLMSFNTVPSAPPATRKAVVVVITNS